MSTESELPVGLYESALTRALEQRLAVLGDAAVVGRLDADEAHRVLAQHVADFVARVVRDLRGHADEDAQGRAVNAVLRLLRGGLGAVLRR